MTEETTKRVEMIVTEIWPSYAEALGHAQLEQIITASAGSADHAPDYDRHRATGGDNFDLLFAMKVITQAALMVSACLSMYDSLTKTFGRKPTLSELQVELQKTPHAEKVVGAVRKRIQDVASKIVE